jgi:hypothetical protein
MVIEENYLAQHFAPILMPVRAHSQQLSVQQYSHFLPQLPNLKSNMQLPDLDLIRAQFGEQAPPFVVVMNQELPMMFQRDGASDLILTLKKLSTNQLKL